MTRLPDLDPFQRLAGRGTHRHPVVLTAMLLLVAAGLIRFWKLGTWSFWADELATLRDAQNLREVITYPIGYVLIGFAVRLFGVGEFAARLVPAVAGTLTVPVFYLLGRRLFSNRAGIIAAGLLALSCYHVYYSQFARYYTLLMLFGLLGMWAAIVGIERNDRRRLAVAAGLLLLAFLTHWTAGLLLPALVVTCLWFTRGEERPHGVNARNMAVLFGPFVVGAAALGPVILGFFRGWTHGSSFSVLRSGLLVLKLVDRMEPSVVLCAIVGVWLLHVGRDYRLKWLLPFAVVPPVLVAMLVAFSRGGSRFAIVSLPAVLLLAGVGLDRLIHFAGPARRKLAWALVGIVILSLSVKDARYFTAERGQRPRWREAVHYVMRTCPNDPILASAPQIVRHYASAGTGQVEVKPLSEFRPDGSESGAGLPRTFIVEHVANVRPTPEQLDAIRTQATLAKTFPLRVRFLDYSISIYREAGSANRQAKTDN